MRNDAQLRAEILQSALRLKGDELRVLNALAGRLVGGVDAYGHLNLATDKRNFQRELSEEILDTAIYSAIQLVRE